MRKYNGEYIFLGCIKNYNKKVIGKIAKMHNKNYFSIFLKINNNSYFDLSNNYLYSKEESSQIIKLKSFKSNIFSEKRLKKILEMQIKTL